MGDDLLDPTLADIAQATETRDARYWVNRIAGDADRIRETALRRLVELGILQREEDRFLWVFRSRRYPVIDGEAEREVKLRIMEVLFSDVIPDPRDVVIIGLAAACGLFGVLLSRRELQRVAERINQVRQLDLIGQAVIQTVAEIDMAISGAMRTII